MTTLSIDSIARFFENARAHAELHNLGNEAGVLVRIIRDLATLRGLPPEAFVNTVPVVGPDAVPMAQLGEVIPGTLTPTLTSFHPANAASHVALDAAQPNLSDAEWNKLVAEAKQRQGKA